MVQDSFVIYQSYQAALNLFEPIYILPDRIDLKGIHYIDDETAAANLEMARIVAALESLYWQ